MNFSSQYPEFILVVVLGLAWFISHLFYHKLHETGDVASKKLVLLQTLRFLSVFLIGVLLLSPQVKITTDQPFKPRIVLLSDNSKSMINSTDSAAIATNIQALEANLKERLADDFTIEHFRFDKELYESEIPSFEGDLSDYQNALVALQAKYAHLPMAGVVLIGDGVFNQGFNPIGFARELNFPIWAVGAGDTISQTDLAIMSVTASPVVYQGQQFQIETEVKGVELLPGNAELQLWLGEKLIEKRSLAIDKPDFFSREVFSVVAPYAGMLRYEFRLVSPQNEFNRINNRKEFVVESLTSKQKILILSDGPHPDIRAIKRALEASVNYTVDVIWSKDAKAIIPNAYRLLILYGQIKDTSSETIDKLIDSDLPKWFITGADYQPKYWNDMNPGLRPTLSVYEFKTKKVVFENGFDRFLIAPEVVELMENMPPLRFPAGAFEVNKNYQTLLTTDADTLEHQPVMVVGETNRIKQAFTLGEGIWRWRMQTKRLTGKTTDFDIWVQKTVRFLALKRKRNNITLDYQKVVSDLQSFVLHAEVLNDSYEELRELEVVVEIEDSNGKVFSNIMDSEQSGYFLNMGKLEPGVYQFRIQTETEAQVLRGNGQFVVKQSQLEFIRPGVDFNLMANMAETSGGKFFYVNQEDEIVEQLMEEVDSLHIKALRMVKMMDILQFEWLLLFIVLLMISEWFLRRFWGLY